jgi:hypothetical protein
MGAADMWLILGILLGVLVGLPLCVALGALLLTTAAALCNVEDLRFLKACWIILVELVITVPVAVGGVLLIGVLGYSVQELKEAPFEQFVITNALLGAVLGVMLMVSVILYRIVIPVGYWRAAKIWVLRFLINVLLAGLAGGMALVGLAVYQIANPK